MLTVQMTEEEKEQIRKASSMEGYAEASVWVRKTLLDRSRRIIQKFGKVDDSVDAAKGMP